MDSTTRTTPRLIAKRSSTYGSHQWGVFDTEAGRFIEIERRTETGAFRGYVAFFRRKMDAQEAIDGCLRGAS